MDYDAKRAAVREAVDIISNAVNETRIDLKERTERGEPLNLHDAFAILAAKIKLWNPPGNMTGPR